MTPEPVVIKAVAPPRSGMACVFQTTWVIQPNVDRTIRQEPSRVQEPVPSDSLRTLRKKLKIDLISSYWGVEVAVLVVVLVTVVATFTPDAITSASVSVIAPVRLLNDVTPAVAAWGTMELKVVLPFRAKYNPDVLTVPVFTKQNATPLLTVTPDAQVHCERAVTIWIEAYGPGAACACPKELTPRTSIRQRIGANSFFIFLLFESQ
jgi:hypothetical protein